MNTAETFAAETFVGYINWQIMQNPYSSLMQQGDPNDPCKDYDMSSAMPQDATSYYHNMQYDPLYGLDEAYGAHQIAPNLVHDYPTLQNSHMHGTIDCMQPSHQSQPLMQSSLPSQTDAMLMASIVSPVTSQIKTEPLNLDNSNISSPSPTAPSTSYEFSAESGDDKSRAGEDNDKTSVRLKKRPLSVPDDQKDGSYWEKRKKNNESAKRSREARRLKEEQIAMKMINLEQENVQLRTEARILKSEIKKLQGVVYGS